MSSKLLKGNIHRDTRGSLFYNNNFDSSAIKRIYLIENNDTNVIRGWQGHKIEERWFSVVQGSFCIKLIKLDNWEFPSVSLVCEEILIQSKTLDVLHVPKGYISSIQATEAGSKLLVMADYLMDELEDDYRFDVNYFEING